VRTATRRSAALALLLAAPSSTLPTAVAGPDDASVLRLEPSLLTEPDRVPPWARVPLERLVAPVGPTAGRALRLDLDGDGAADATVPAGKAKVVQVARGERRVPVLLRGRAGRWEAVPAGLLVGAQGRRSAAVLDLDQDGAFGGPGDLIAWGDGAFQRLPASRRLGSATEVVTFRLEADAEPTSRLHVAPLPRPEGTTDEEWRGLLAVAGYRNALGLPPLLLDRARSDACRRHAEYIRLNPTDGFGHEEVPGRPGYSEEGRRAAQEGVMERTADPAVAVARLTRMMLHRTPFLCREDVGLGVGSTRLPVPGPGGSEGLGTGFTVLWAGKALDSDEYPIVVPGPGAVDVPRELLEEMPPPDAPRAFYDAPRGYAVSVSFVRQRAASAAGAPTLVLREREGGKAVPATVWSPWNPVARAFDHNYATLFLAPHAPLDPASEYVVEATGTAAPPGLPALVWTFRTAR
jgi:hypothetical protein